MNPASLPFGPLRLAVLAGIAASSCASATAAEAGVHHCRVETALSVDRSGGVTAIAEAPESFEFRAYDAPVTGEELRSPLRRRQAIDPENAGGVSASIGAPLFTRKADALRSTDGRLYAQGGMTFSLDPDGSFLAYGPAEGGGLRVAIYAGVCEPPTLGDTMQ
jgi:hypothetical protein